MATVIEVQAVTGRKLGVFAQLVLFHQDCDGIPLTRSRNPIKQEYTLQCTCSLTLRVREHSAAIEAFEATAADQQPRTLAAGTYLSSAGDELQVVAKPEN